MIDDNPKINTILNTLEPIALPTAISFSPFLAATILVTSSGRDVPTATIVNATNNSLIPSSIAILLALSTTNLPPATIPANPSTINNKLKYHFLFFSSTSSSAG